MTPTRTTTVLLSAALLTAACTGSSETPTTPALPAETTVECVNIRRAYTAWSSADRLPETPDDVRTINEVTVGLWKRDGDRLLEAVTGYDDQPSKTLAVAVAEYNVAVSLAAIPVGVGMTPTDDTVDKVLNGVVDIHSAYARFNSEVCT